MKTPLTMLTAALTTLLTLLGSNAAAQQANPDLIAACADVLRISAYNELDTSEWIKLDEASRTQFCLQYSRQRHANVGVSAKRFDVGGASLTRDQAEAVYSLECLDDRRSARYERDAVVALRHVSPLAISAYESCLKVAAGGLSTHLSASSRERITITLSAHDKRRVRHVDIVGEGVECSGSLTDLDQQWRWRRTLRPGDSTSMICTRDVADGGALPEFSLLVEFENGAPFSYTWPGRAPCGIRGERQCPGSSVRGTLSREYPASFLEESVSGYATSGLISAVSRADALVARSQRDRPASCSAQDVADWTSKTRDALRAEWKTVTLSSSANHSCTKDYSGGTKDCKCRYTAGPPRGFEPAGSAQGGEWEGSKGRICLKKSGKGKITGSVTATFALSEATINERVERDLALMRSHMACFNGCAPGLSPNAAGICL